MQKTIKPKEEFKLKFKAWDKEERIMIDNVQDDYVCHEEWGCSFSDLLDNDRFIVMQYTGYKDEKGKEIYGGDIIRVSLSSYGYKYVNQEVLFPDDYDWVKNVSHYSKVIGNKYPNPKLLDTIGCPQPPQITKIPKKNPKHK